MKNLSLTIALLLTYTLAFSQSESKEFEPSGSPVIKIYSNFHSGISDKAGESAFEITRAYFGYTYKLSPEFEVETKLDIGSPNDASEYSLLKRFAYFKTASLIYKHKNLKVNFGLIGLQQFSLPEKFWAHRYLYYSFQDLHKFGTSADLGVSASYKLNDQLNVDFTIMNGEGYKQLQSDDIYKIAGGITITPIKPLIMRVYYDYTKNEIAETSLSAFVGYTFDKKFKIGGEYNLKTNNKWNENNNMSGISTYAMYNITEKIEAFGRYDYLTSNKLDNAENPWNLSKNGSALIGGLQYTPQKNIKISLNYQDWYPSAQNTTNQSYIYMSLEFGI